MLWLWRWLRNIQFFSFVLSVFCPENEYIMLFAFEQTPTHILLVLELLKVEHFKYLEILLRVLYLCNYLFPILKCFFRPNDILSESKE